MQSFMRTIGAGWCGDFLLGLYEFANNTVTVYCVFHNSRDPQKWRERLS
jgi:hypothetical protein